VKFGVIRICSFKEILDAGRAALMGVARLTLDGHVTPRENCRARTVAPKFDSRHSRRATRVARSRGRHSESRGVACESEVGWVGAGGTGGDRRHVTPF
jgi:hypothetical protein